MGVTFDRNLVVIGGGSAGLVTAYIAAASKAKVTLVEKQVRAGDETRHRTEQDPRTIHTYPTLAEANKYVAGNWKRAHAPQALLAWVERFHAWRRG